MSGCLVPHHVAFLTPGPSLNRRIGTLALYSQGSEAGRGAGEGRHHISGARYIAGTLLESAGQFFQ